MTCGRPILQLAHGDMEGNGFCLSRRQMDAVKGHQFPFGKSNTGRPLFRRAEIGLRHLVTINEACVLDREAEIKTAITRFGDCEARIGELAVAQTVAESEKRRDLFRIEPAIS